jgi:carbon-monoxide dehydrogenase large subunit
VIRAVVDSLRDPGVRHLDRPATSEKIRSITTATAPRMAAE